MRIAIDARVANDADAHRWLDRILHKIEDGWHVWDTTDQELDMVDTKWIRSGGERIREMLVASVQRSAWTLEPHRRSVRVTAAPSNPDELSPEDAAGLAEEPLCILVENRFSDGPFVKRVVKELAPGLHDLWNQRNRPIRFDSVGGKGQMPDVVDRRAKGKRCRPRLVAVIDSDRRAPGEQPSTVARRLFRTCAGHGVPCWILAKREAENYLPRVLLEALPNKGAAHRRIVAAWNSLTDDQKNFFDMKKGLPANLSAVEQKLFAGLSPGDRTTLSNGFGSNVHQCWCLRNVPARRELVIRGQGDLERGIELIRSEV